MVEAPPTDTLVTMRRAVVAVVQVGMGGRDGVVEAPPLSVVSVTKSHSLFIVSQTYSDTFTSLSPLVAVGRIHVGVVVPHGRRR